MNDQLLKTALTSNLVFSTISAIASVAAADQITAINQMASGDGLVFGVQLLVFAAFISFVLWKKKFSATFIYIIIILDVLFVLGVIVRFALDKSFTLGGYFLTGISAFIVSVLAISQWLGFKRLAH